MTKEEMLEYSGPLDQCPVEPDFDDELSILNARPVVPLALIREKSQNKSRWFLFGAFALAMFLGAASGLISAYFKLREVPETRVIQSDVSNAASLSSKEVEEILLQMVTAEPFNKSSSNLSTGFMLEEEPKLVTPRRVGTELKRATRNTEYSVPLPNLSEDEQLRIIREGLLMKDSQNRRPGRSERLERLRF